MVATSSPHGSLFGNPVIILLRSWYLARNFRYLRFNRAANQGNLCISSALPNTLGLTTTVRHVGFACTRGILDIHTLLGFLTPPCRAGTVIRWSRPFFVSCVGDGNHTLSRYGAGPRSVSIWVIKAARIERQAPRSCGMLARYVSFLADFDPSHPIPGFHIRYPASTF